MRDDLCYLYGVFTFSSLATPFRRWRERYGQWWLNRKVSPLIQQGIGYRQCQLSAGDMSDDRATERVIEFVKRAIAESRQPYGFSLYLVSISAVLPSEIGPGIFQCPAEDFLPPFDRKAFRPTEIQAIIRERVAMLNRDKGKEIVVAFNSAGDLLTAHYDATHVSGR